MRKLPDNEIWDFSASWSKPRPKLNLFHAGFPFTFTSIIFYFYIWTKITDIIIYIIYIYPSIYLSIYLSIYNKRFSLLYMRMRMDQLRHQNFKNKQTTNNTLELEIIFKPLDISNTKKEENIYKKHLYD